MRYPKQQLIKISSKVQEKKPVTPQEIQTLLAFTKLPGDSRLNKVLKNIALPASLVFGFLFSAFPSYFNNLVAHMPAWTNFSPEILLGVDYLWDLLGDPVKKANVLYHIPNVILYSFGIVGVKKLVEAIDRKTWLDRVLHAQHILQTELTAGSLAFHMRKGHSLLFIGQGDFVGMQFVLNHKDGDTVTISQSKPAYTLFWNYYNVDTLYEDLKNVIVRANGHNAGEYLFFPVKDDQIFLPNEKAYDLSPHRLDILCQNIRMIEKELKWKPKRIIIIGDKFHKSFVQSEDKRRVIKKSGDVISLESIAGKYSGVTLLDPSDIVMKEIIKLAMGRKIVFRATKEGIAEYKQRFYHRLELLGFRQLANKRGVLTIGYDLFEDQTEQQTLSRKIDDYYPVVLSKNVRDALIRNGYKTSEFLYVPELVLTALSQEASKQ